MLTESEERELRQLRAERRQEAIDELRQTARDLAFTDVQIPSDELDRLCDAAGATRGDLNELVRIQYEMAASKEAFERQVDAERHREVWGPRRR